MKHPAHDFIRSIESMRFSACNVDGLVLDAGCGDGTFAQDTFHGVIVGLDYSIARLTIAKKMLPHVVLGDLRRLPFKEQAFDFAVSNSTIEHVNSCDKVLSELAKTAKNVIISVPSSRASRVPAIDVLFGMVNTLSLSEWESAMKRAGVRIKTSFYYMPLVSQLVYYCSLLFPMCVLVPKALRKRWSARRNDGVLAFIWGVNK